MAMVLWTQGRGERVYRGRMGRGDSRKRSMGLVTGVEMSWRGSILWGGLGGVALDGLEFDRVKVFGKVGSNGSGGVKWKG